MKKILFMIAFLMISGFLIGCFSAEVSEVNLRVEGTDSCLFCQDLKWTENETLAELIGKLRSELNPTGLEDGYITSFGNETAGTFGGWDGWMFLVNGELSSLSITDTVLQPGDEIVFFYGDPYGVGFQFPVMKDELLEEGILSFVSLDTVYDENWNPSVQENPVPGLSVTVGDCIFVTDEEGRIDCSALSDGVYSVSFEKKAENGLPLVLRSAPVLTLVIPERISAPAATSDGDLLFLIFGALSLSAVVVFLKRRHG